MHTILINPRQKTARMYAWLNWSVIKRTILIGSLSGWNFVIQTAKVDRSQSNFSGSLFQIIAQNEQSVEHSEKRCEKLKLGDKFIH